MRAARGCRLHDGGLWPAVSVLPLDIRRGRNYLFVMNAKVRTIEVDSGTADVLEARAAARGMSVSDLLADLACNEEALPADLAALRAAGEGPWSAEALQEDARRLADF